MTWTTGKTIDPWLEEVKKAFTEQNENVYSIEFVGPKGNLLEFRARFGSSTGPVRYAYSNKDLPCTVDLYDHKIDCLCGACQGAI